MGRVDSSSTHFPKSATLVYHRNIFPWLEQRGSASKEHPISVYAACWSSVVVASATATVHALGVLLLYSCFKVPVQRSADPTDGRVAAESGVQVPVDMLTCLLGTLSTR